MIILSNFTTSEISSTANYFLSSVQCILGYMSRTLCKLILVALIKGSSFSPTSAVNILHAVFQEENNIFGVAYAMSHK